MTAESMGQKLAGQVPHHSGSEDPILERADPLVDQLAEEISSDPQVAPRLIAIIWTGSRSHGLDVHRGSDFDIQIVMDRPDIDAMVALSAILPRYSPVDLSILYPKDVWDNRGNLDFQDGTKGAFFIPVLAEGRIVHGIDFYQGLRRKLPALGVRNSLEFTIREYLARLRVATIRNASHSFEFKKYVMKTIKDLLVYAGQLPLTEMTTIGNADLITMAKEAGLIWTDPSCEIDDLVDYTQPMEAVRRAKILQALEETFDSLRHNSSSPFVVQPPIGS